MRCYYHRDQDAVGVCKSCGRGLCVECAADIGKGLACRSRCEEDARAIVQVVDRNIRLGAKSEALLHASQRSRLGAGLFYLVLGGVFLVGGLMDRERFTILIVLGGCMIAFGLFYLLAVPKSRSGVPRE
jgi:hypothetical protein